MAKQNWKIEDKERRLVITEAQQKIKEEEFRNSNVSIKRLVLLNVSWSEIFSKANKRLVQ